MLAPRWWLLSTPASISRPALTHLGALFKSVAQGAACSACEEGEEYGCGCCFPVRIDTQAPCPSRSTLSNSIWHRQQRNALNVAGPLAPARWMWDGLS